MTTAHRRRRRMRLPRAHLRGPLCRSRRPRPSSRRTRRCRRIAQVQRALGLQRVVLVQPTGYGFDNRCLLDALAQLGAERARRRGRAARRRATPNWQRLHAAGVRGVRFMMLPAPARAALGRAARDGRAHRAARLAHRPAARRPRAAAARGADRPPAGPAGDRPHRPLPRAGAGRTTPRSRRCCRLLDAGRRWVKLSAPYETSKRRAAATTTTWRRWRGRWPSAPGALPVGQQLAASEPRAACRPMRHAGAARPTGCRRRGARAAHPGRQPGAGLRLLARTTAAAPRRYYSSGCSACAASRSSGSSLSTICTSDVLAERQRSRSSRPCTGPCGRSAPPRCRSGRGRAAARVTQ